MFFKKRQRKFRDMLAEYDTLRIEASEYSDIAYPSYRLAWFTPGVVAILLMAFGGGFTLIFGTLGQEFGASQNPDLRIISDVIIFLGLLMLMVALAIPACCKNNSLSFFSISDMAFLQDQIDRLRNRIYHLR